MASLNPSRDKSYCTSSHCKYDSTTNNFYLISNKYLEYLYLESSFVQQIYVTCLKFRPLVAIIIPDMEVLYWWAKEHNIYHDFR